MIIKGCNSDADCLGPNEKCDTVDKICRVPCDDDYCIGVKKCDPSKRLCVPCKKNKSQFQTKRTLMFLVCDPRMEFRNCDWPNKTCNEERQICGEQCTENENCKEGEYCDTKLGVCVPGKINFLILGAGYISSSCLGCNSNDDCHRRIEKCDLFDHRCKRSCDVLDNCKHFNKTCDKQKKLCVGDSGIKPFNA